MSITSETDDEWRAVTLAALDDLRAHLGRATRSWREAHNAMGDSDELTSLYHCIGEAKTRAGLIRDAVGGGCPMKHHKKPEAENAKLMDELSAENAKLREELVRVTARYIAENDELRLALVMSRADGLVALEQRGKALLENAELRSKYERLRGAIA